MSGHRESDHHNQVKVYGMKLLLTALSNLFRTAVNAGIRCVRYREGRDLQCESRMLPPGESKSEARKAASGGERQAAPSLEGIRPDHRGRYTFAKQFVNDGAKVLDVACGVGYGAYIIAQQTACAKVLAVDNCEDAISYGSKYYMSPKIEYRMNDCISISLDPEGFDIIICFETIEHIMCARQLLEKFYLALKPCGLLICSTPNQQTIPFSRSTHPFHVKHYTPAEFGTLLRNSGFQVEQLWSQNNHLSPELTEGWGGLCNIAVCRRRS